MTSRSAAANAALYARTPRVIGIVGPYNSGCAFEQLPITNRAPGGPLAMISPTNTLLPLTKPLPGGDPGLLGRLYPTGVRHFARLFGSDDAQAAALVRFAHARGLPAARDRRGRRRLLRPRDRVARTPAGKGARTAGRRPAPFRHRPQPGRRARGRRPSRRGASRCGAVRRRGLGQRVSVRSRRPGARAPDARPGRLVGRPMRRGKSSAIAPGGSTPRPPAFRSTD